MLQWIFLVDSLVTNQYISGIQEKVIVSEMGAVKVCSCPKNRKFGNYYYFLRDKIKK